MIAKFESREPNNPIKLWYGKYAPLYNLLHWHKEIEIIHVLQGTAKISSRGIVYSVHSGQTMFIESGVIHNITSDSNDTIIALFIFDGKFLVPIGDTYKLCCPLIENDTSFCSLYELIKTEFKNQSAFFEKRIQAQITEYVINLYRKTPHQLNTESNSEAADKIYSLLDNIDQNYSYLTFQEACNLLGYSTSHFSRLFLQLTGVNFTNYLNSVKVEKAIKMLKTSDRKVSDIAMDCGFSSIRQFNRVFKNVTGFTPRNIPIDYKYELQAKKGALVHSSEYFNPTLPSSNLMED